MEGQKTAGMDTGNRVHQERDEEKCERFSARIPL
jgi:hypothetical protein